jgi:lysophospholipase L1-like esterase
VTDVRVAAVVLALVAALFLSSCADPRAAAPDAATAPTAAPDAVRLAVVGDSITEADSPDFDGGRLGPESWLEHTVGDGVVLVGGWARWGATTAQMAAAVEPVEADVLVVLAGTNDVGSGEAAAETPENLRRIADVVGAPRVVLSAVPPIDAAPHLATGLNAELEDLAAEEGWEWVDAPAGLRDGARFAEGMASDGLHPTEAGARVIGEAIRGAVLGAGGRGPDAGG